MFDIIVFAAAIAIWTAGTALIAAAAIVAVNEAERRFAPRTTVPPYHRTRRNG